MSLILLFHPCKHYFNPCGPVRQAAGSFSAVVVCPFAELDQTTGTQTFCIASQTRRVNDQPCFQMTQYAMDVLTCAKIPHDLELRKLM